MSAHISFNFGTWFLSKLGYMNDANRTNLRTAIFWRTLTKSIMCLTTKRQLEEAQPSANKLNSQRFFFGALPAGTSPRGVRPFSWCTDSHISGCVHCPWVTIPRGQCGKKQPRGQTRESNPARGIQSPTPSTPRPWWPLTTPIGVHPLPVRPKVFNLKQVNITTGWLRERAEKIPWRSKNVDNSKMAESKRGTSNVILNRNSVV